MLGSYLSAITAISVVQLNELPLVVRWLWPSAIGIPAILWWVRRRETAYRDSRQVTSTNP